jgi:hypothetical protein
MKLTIDTKEDSKEEIRKAIRMLAAIVDDSSIYTNADVRKGHQSNIFESGSSSITPSSAPSPEPQQGSVFGNIFGDIGQSSSSEKGKETSEEKKEKKPEIIIEY